MYAKRYVTIIALALAGVAFLAVGAGATTFTWTGGVNSAWVQATSPYNWSGGSATNGRSPGSTHTNYTDQAIINATTNNPVTFLPG